MSETGEQWYQATLEWVAAYSERPEITRRVDLKQRFLIIARGLAFALSDKAPQPARIEGVGLAAAHGFREVANQEKKKSRRSGSPEFSRSLHTFSEDLRQARNQIAHKGIAIQKEIQHLKSVAGSLLG